MTFLANLLEINIASNQNADVQLHWGHTNGVQHLLLVVVLLAVKIEPTVAASVFHNNTLMYLYT